MVEAGKSTYQGKNESDLIEEKIDEVILRALGLDDVFDLDYGTYKTLLKERMMADRMGQKMDSSEVEAVTNEYKRVKTKTGRFRLNKKKVTASAFKTKKTGPTTAPITAASRILPGSTFAPAQKLIAPEKETAIVQAPQQQTSIAKTKQAYTYNFSKIEGALDDINKNLKGSFSFEKEKEKKKKQEEGRKKKKERESNLEKTIGAIAKIGKKILQPLKGPLDYIINWITYTFLGKVVHNLLNWMSDPDNAKKMMSLGRFFKDWWPALVGAYLIFGNSLGRFVSRLIFTVGAFTTKMLVGAIPKLLRVVRTPLGAGALLFGAGAAIPMLMPETVDEQERKTSKAVKEQGQDKVRTELERKANKPNFFERLTGQDAEAKEQLYKMDTGQTKSYGFRKGGKVTTASGTDIKGAGVDTQLIAARPGEVVINKETVDALGANFFLALNKKYGGSNANKPKLAKNIQTAAGGGLVLPAFANGGRIRDDYDGPDPRDSPTGSFANDPIGALMRIYNRESEKYFPRGSGERNMPPESDSKPTPSSRQPKPGGGSTGSLLNDPFGAAKRVYDRYFPSNQSSGTIPPPLPPLKDGKPTTSGSTPKQEEPGIAEKILKSSTFRDSGLQYLRSMMGGIGGPVTETQLSKESKDELTKAIERARKRTSRELAIATQDLAKAKKEKWSNLAEVQGVYDRLKRGEIRVEYEDYFEKGKISPAAEDAKSILGKFWARASTDGGYRVVNEKYDFVDMPDPWAVIRGDSRGISKVDANKAKRSITLRERLQAFYQINPFARDMEVDMVLGKKKGDPLRTIQNTATMMIRSNPLVNDAFYLADQLRGKPQPPMSEKEKMNQKRLESQRPWWDKMGWFGGASAEKQRQQKNKPVYGPGGSATGSGRGQAQQKPKPKPKPKLNKAQQIYGASTPSITKTKPPQRAWYDPRGWVGKQGGGEITESTGMNMPGAAADRQLIATQPGEYILPVDAVMKLGGPNTIDRLVATLDSNSTPAKMGARKLKPIPGPPSVAGRSGMMTLPPITSGSSSGVGGSGKGERKQVPSFSATSPYTGERKNNADIYGIR